MRPQLAYYNLDARVTAFSTTRHGGFSSGNYGELNVNAYCGDSLEAIRKNRLLLSNELGLQRPEDLIIPHQIHEDIVLQVDREFLASPLQERQERLEGVDALMTDCPNICIGVSTADCTPIIIYDPSRHCAAVVHAGWRGTVKRIAQKTVTAMAEAFGSTPSVMRAVIGPCISLKNFEVGREVYDQFAEAGFPMEQIATDPRRSSDYQACPFCEEPKPHIDLPLCNCLQLQEAGVPSANISYCGVCTFDRVDDYFSARRLGIQSGRIYTGIVLR